MCNFQKKLWITASLFFLFLTSCIGEEVASCEVNVKFVKDKFFINEPIVAMVTIINTGTKEISIPYHSLVYRANVSFRFNPADQLKIDTFKNEQMGDGPSATEKILAKSKFSYEVILNNFILFKSAGSYKFWVNFLIEYTDGRIDKSGMKIIHSITVEQELTIEVLEDDEVLLENIYNNLYKNTLLVKSSKKENFSESFDSAKKLCCVRNKLVLKYLELMADSKQDGIADIVTDAFEKFGVDAKSGLEKIIKNESVEKFIKLRAEKMLKKLN